MIWLWKTCNNTKSRLHRMYILPVVPGGAMAPLVFGWSVNPISTKGGRLCLPNNTGTPGFSDLPTALQAKSWPENGQCQGNHQMIGDYLLKLKREYDHSLLVNRDSACPTSKVQLPLRRSKYSILCFYTISLCCLELKSYGFKKKLVDSCQALTRSF